MINLSSYDRVFLLTDEQAAFCCLPVLLMHLGQPDIADTLVLPAGEQHKNILSVQRIWDWLFARQATRRSLLINLGGGVICDMGGFAAATYMRGMPFVNVPTTLLAMVDAGAGGKTGIDYCPSSFNGGVIKNAVGVFAEPAETLLLTAFLRTLPPEQLLSGYAEMLKHALLAGQEACEAFLSHDLRDTQSEHFERLLHASVDFKEHIVSQDIHDNGIRQVLNFGHTVGHAIESLLLEKKRLNNCETGKCFHGYCVMYGMVAEAYLSHMLCGLPAEAVSKLSRFMLENYGAPPLSCRDHETLISLMMHDKKNQKQGTIVCTLLQAVGSPRIRQTVTPGQLREALEYLCSL